MKPSEFNSYIIIDEYSSTPKYKQLVNAIYLAIEKGILQKNSPLPSINELSFKLELSRDTAEKGYRQLRKLGVIESVPGKGYFISNTNFSARTKVCLLFNKLSSHKKSFTIHSPKLLAIRLPLTFMCTITILHSLKNY